jgi:hypothetical protein
MMYETKSVRQIKGEPLRRWFWSDYFDLIVWINDDRDITGFQLCYDKNKFQRVLTWKKESGYSHDRIDDGESNPGRYKSTPILAADGIFEEEKIAALFKEESSNLDKQIADFIHSRILEYGIK